MIEITSKDVINKIDSLIDKGFKLIYKIDKGSLFYDENRAYYMLDKICVSKCFDEYTLTINEYEYDKLAKDVFNYLDRCYEAQELNKRYRTYKAVSNYLKHEN